MGIIAAIIGGIGGLCAVMGIITAVEVLPPLMPEFFQTDCNMSCQSFTVAVFTGTAEYAEYVHGFDERVEFYKLGKRLKRAVLFLRLLATSGLRNSGAQRHDQLPCEVPGVFILQSDPNPRMSCSGKIDSLAMDDMAR